MAEWRLKRKAWWIIGVHFLIVVTHSVAHEVLAVRATATQLAFIIPVIFLAPIASGLMMQRQGRFGAWLLSLSMIGSFLFGVYYHFIAMTIDHVAHVATLHPPFWVAVFIITAYALAVVELAGALAGAIMLRSRSLT